MLHFFISRLIKGANVISLSSFKMGKEAEEWGGKTYEELHFMTTT